METALAKTIRETIRARGPQTFAWFMEQALYHPEHGYYSTGHARIGRRGDYFTNVSLGPLFGKLLAAQFAEMWDRLGKIDNFVIVEQGAHHGDFARDVLCALRETASQCFSSLRYVIVEPFPILQDRQSQTLQEFAGKIEWRKSLDNLEAFIGVHFSNELLDAMPVHLLVRRDGEWREKLVTASHDELAFVDATLSSVAVEQQAKKLPPISSENYETEVSLAALDWIENVSRKVQRGFVLIVDYGFPREQFYSQERAAGTLSCLTEHKRASSPLDSVGKIDITARVDWTSLAERARDCGLKVAGFTDQHHFITGVISELGGEVEAFDPKSKRALQTLLHPELLGRTFQFLLLQKDVDPVRPLSGLKFARDSNALLGT
ncbi:MAG: hypothetical protein QOI04_122 [Verrucomicrobiota bacterium]